MQELTLLRYRLQHKAITAKKAERIIQELHGSLKHVHCLSKLDSADGYSLLCTDMCSDIITECGTSLDRDDVQEELSRLNPEWEEYLNDNIRNGVSSESSTRLHCMFPSANIIFVLSDGAKNKS